MNIRLERFVVLVDDYDKATEFYTKNLGAEVTHDVTAGGQRFLHIGFGGKTPSLWLLEARSAHARSLVGSQTAGEPLLVFYTDDAQAVHDRLKESGVTITSGPESGQGATYFHFLDLYGNHLIMAELK